MGDDARRHQEGSAQAEQWPTEGQEPIVEEVGGVTMEQVNPGKGVEQKPENYPTQEEGAGAFICQLSSVTGRGCSWECNFPCVRAGQPSAMDMCVPGVGGG